MTKLTLHTILNGATAGLGVGIVAWVALLTTASLRVQEAQSITYHLKLGPLLLNTLSKQVGTDSTKAAITFDNGLWLYMAICLCLGVLVPVLRAALSKKQSQPSS